MARNLNLVPERTSPRGNMFAPRFTNLLVAKRITQRDFASQIGLSPSVISEYCSGEREPTLTNLVRIAVYFGVTTDYLLGSETDGLTCDASTLARAEAAALVRRLSTKFAQELMAAADDFERMAAHIK